MYRWRTTRLRFYVIKFWTCFSTRNHAMISLWVRIFCNSVHHVTDNVTASFNKLQLRNIQINSSNQELCSCVHCSARILVCGPSPCIPETSQGCMIVGHILQKATGAKVSLQIEEIMVRKANSTDYEKCNRDTEFCL